MVVVSFWEGLIVLRARDARRIRAGIVLAHFRIECMVRLGVAFSDEVSGGLEGRAFDRTVSRFAPVLRSHGIYVGRGEHFVRGRVKRVFVSLVDMRETLPKLGEVPSLAALRLERKRLAQVSG